MGWGHLGRVAWAMGTRHVSVLPCRSTGTTRP